MADASEAVFNSGKTIWPGFVRLKCYAHVFLVRTLFFFTFFYRNSLTQKFALTSRRLVMNKTIMIFFLNITNYPQMITNVLSITEYGKVCELN
jgi:hypothetical protein